MPGKAKKSTTKASIFLKAQARQDLKAAFHYLEEKNPNVGDKFLESARATLILLAEMPKIGALRNLPNIALTSVRQWPVGGFRHYLIFYRELAEGNGIEVIRILHSARDIAGQLNE